MRKKWPPLQKDFYARAEVSWRGGGDCNGLLGGHHNQTSSGRTERKIPSTIAILEELVRFESLARNGRKLKGPKHDLSETPIFPTMATRRSKPAQEILIGSHFHEVFYRLCERWHITNVKLLSYITYHMSNSRIFPSQRASWPYGSRAVLRCSSALWSVNTVNRRP